MLDAWRQRGISARPPGAGWLLLVAALAGTRPATALDVKVWPLFQWTRDAARDDTRWTFLGPLVEFRRTAGHRELHVRPLVSLRQGRGGGHDDRADLLFPLASTRWTDDYRALRFVLFTYRTQPRAAGETAPWTRRFTLFPFVFYREDPDGRATLSVLPFYLDLPDLFGYERVQGVMLPAFLRLVEPHVERRFYGFPFVSTVGGSHGRGLRVWPLWGRTEVVGRERTAYVLWPFHIRSERLVPGCGWERRRLDLPFVGALDGAGRRSRAYGVLAYTHTVDERRGSEAVGSPWPFVFRERALGAEAYRTWRLAPLFGRSEHGAFSSRFWAWPAWRSRAQDDGDFHYRRRDALLVLWREQRQWNEATGRRTALVTVFPALRSEARDGRRFGQLPALADSLMPRNRGVLTSWAPLWGVVRWDTAPDGSREWSLLWGLLARERGRLVGPWHVALDDGAAEGGAGH